MNILAVAEFGTADKNTGMDWDIERNQPIEAQPPDNEPALDGAWPIPQDDAAGARSLHLVACHDCGKTVSRRADACPHCGSVAFDRAHRLDQSGRQLMRLGFWLLVLAVLILVPLLFVL